MLIAFGATVSPSMQAWVLRLGMKLKLQAFDPGPPKTCNLNTCQPARSGVPFNGASFSCTTAYGCLREPVEWSLETEILSECLSGISGPEFTSTTQFGNY